MAPEVEASAEDLRVFLQEAAEQIAVLDEDITRLEAEAGNPELLQEIFRAAHTLKGSSGMLGLRDLATLTHVMEEALDGLRTGALAVTPALVDALLDAVDSLRLLTENVTSPDAHVVPVAAICEAIQNVADTAATTPVARESLDDLLARDQDLRARAAAAGDVVRIRASVDPASQWASVRLFQALQELASLGELLASSPTNTEIEEERAGNQLEALVATGAPPETVAEVLLAIDEFVAAEVAPYAGIAAAPEPAAVSPEATPARPDAQTTVRIDVERLDAMMNLAGELVVDRTRISELTHRLQSRYPADEDVRAVDEITAHIGKMVEDLNAGMLQARMLPVGVLFSKFPRLVRDVARATGRLVDFETHGEGTEIDRSIIERIKDPLMHLLRNAVDHGIETPETRLAAGKPEHGRVRLTARHEQSQIVIELSDDGAGIDASALRKRAVKTGTMTKDAAARLSDADAINLIFESGFSTAAQTTEISGRGVGMDVVRNSVQALNGLMTVDTRPGAGTTFRLQLPLTLATFRGLLVESGDTVFAIPLGYVQETGRLEQRFVERVVDKEVVNLRGAVLPLVRLRHMTSGRPDHVPYSTFQSREAAENAEPYMVVVNAGERPAAVAVDGLIQQQEIVVKSMGRHAGQPRGIAGASILGDGKVALIVDVATLLKAA